MRLRFIEDRRTLIWAFGLFPLGPALAYFRPGLLLWLTPLLLYCSYLSGVLSHNHNHSPVFHGRTANLIYGAWLSFMYGFPTFAWVPSHNQNHHRHLNSDEDASAISRHSSRDSLFAALSYPLACSRHQLPLVWRYARSALARPSGVRQRVLVECGALVLGHALAAVVAIGLHGPGLGALVYGVTLGAPALLGTYWMMLTNYLQHVGCDPGSAHDHSRNFVSPFWNWFVFDNGYHTVHHQQPGLHWSRYRALHEKRAASMSPALNQPMILAYAARRYLWPRRADGVAPEST
jgi:beta-carotene hydroxylase